MSTETPQNTSTLKRFIVFIYDYYYPSGGWADFAGTYDTLDEALAKCGTIDEDKQCAHVVDLHLNQQTVYSIPEWI